MMLGQLDNYYGKKINLYPYFPPNTDLWIKCKVKTISFEKNTEVIFFFGNLGIDKIFLGHRMHYQTQREKECHQIRQSGIYG